MSHSVCVESVNGFSAAHAMEPLPSTAANSNLSAAFSVLILDRGSDLAIATRERDARGPPRAALHSEDKRFDIKKRPVKFAAAITISELCIRGGFSPSRVSSSTASPDNMDGRTR